MAQERECRGILENKLLSVEISTQAMTLVASQKRNDSVMSENLGHSDHVVVMHTTLVSIRSRKVISLNC
jgi:hypothetical protein